MQNCDPNSKWIFSGPVDFVAFTLPMAFSVLALPFMMYYIPENDMPLWAYFLTVVVCDVGHVWTTLFRTYFDSDQMQRRPMLYWGAPIVIFLISVVLHFISAGLYWIVLGYAAIYHFVKQFFGFLALYKARGKERWDWTFDKVYVYSGALLPIIYWHSTPGRKFDWFQREDSLPIQLPSLFQPLCVIAYAVMIIVWFAKQISLKKDGKFNLGKNLLMVYCWTSWAFGVLIPHKVVSLCFLNLIHALPVFFIVFFVSRNKWLSRSSISPMDQFTKWICSGSRWPVYLAFLISIAVVEEVLWDVLVWQDYSEKLLEALEWEWEPDDLSMAFITSTLALPQAVHYFLDAFIWKMNENDNPGLKEAACMIPPKVLPMAVDAANSLHVSIA